MEPCVGFRQLCPTPSLQRPVYRDVLINCTMGMRGNELLCKITALLHGLKEKRAAVRIKNSRVTYRSPEGVGWATIYISLIT